MKAMIIDISTDKLFVSFIHDDTEIFREVLIGHNNHSENLMNVIIKRLNELSLEVKDFDKIYFGIGPGSYTGLRIAATIAKMFAWTLDLPLYVISSLDILGSGYYHNDGIYAITSVAKKDYVYGKIVQIENGKYKTILDDSFMLETEFVTKAKGLSIIKIDDYCFDSFKIMELATLVSKDKLHDLVPNYLRVANS